MKAIMLNIDTDAPVLNTEAEWAHMEGLTVFELGLYDVLEHWGDDDDSFIPKEHVTIALETGALVVDSLAEFARLFQNISVDWLEQSWRDQCAGEPTEESKFEESVATGWTDLSNRVQDIADVFGRVRHVNKFISYDAVKLQR